MSTTFTPAERRLLAIADQVEDQVENHLSWAERNRLQTQDSVARRIERIGLAEFNRIKAEQRRRWKQRQKRRTA